jgi:hypothetical protein
MLDSTYWKQIDESFYVLSFTILWIMRRLWSVGELYGGEEGFNAERW